MPNPGKKVVKERAAILAAEFEKLQAEGATPSKRSLAKRLTQEHPGLWPNAEACRDSIRYMTNQRGARSRKGVAGDIYLAGPRVLLFDIETAPMKSYHWGKWKQNIQDIFVEQDWFCLSWAAKWLDGEKIIGDVLTPDEALAEDDGRIMRLLWDLCDSADVMIAHNADKFDLPRIRTRMFLNDLPPFSSVQMIDTLKVLRKEFAFSSNRLDYICKMLKIKGKVDTGGFELWRSCMEGDREALEKMLYYNVNDVKILEEVYKKLLPYIKSHPNFGVYVDANTPVCPSCGSEDIEAHGHYITNASRFPQFICRSCGAVMRSRFSELPIEKRRNLLIGTAR